MKAAMINWPWGFGESICFGWRLSGEPDDPAQFADFSDIKEERPRHLHEPEHEVQR